MDALLNVMIICTFPASLRAHGAAAVEIKSENDDQTKGRDLFVHVACKSTRRARSDPGLTIAGSVDGAGGAERHRRGQPDRVDRVRAANQPPLPSSMRTELTARR